MDHVINKINAFADLPEDWDSYGAAEISDTAMRKAVGVVEYLGEHGLAEGLCVNAFPVCNGSVQLDIDLHYGRRGVEIECEADGTVTVTYFDDNCEVVSGLGRGVHCQTIEDFLLNRI